LLKGAKSKIPPLELFDQKIAHLKNIQTEIQRINTPIEIAWLKISLQPLKNSLNAKVLAWINVFTSFLQNQFRTTLKNLREFIQATAQGILKNPVDHQKDKTMLMNVMKTISDVKEVEPQTDGIIRRVKEMVNVLKQHGYLSQEKGDEEPLQAIDNA